MSVDIHPQELPVFYGKSHATQELRETNPDLAMLQTLRSELMWAPSEAERIKSLYAVSRNLGDEVLFAGDESGEVRHLLDTTRYDAKPEHYLVEEQESTTATHSEVDRRVAMDFQQVEDLADSMMAHFEAAGTPLEQKGDALVAIYLGIAAHETGHAMLSGVSVLSADIVRKNLPTAQGRGRHLATRLFLGGHPEQGITGNWDTDVAIHEERFAEGYSNVVIRKAMKTLGYKDDVVEKMVAFQAAGDLYAPEGRHQLDHLDKITKDASAKEIMQQLANDDDLKRHGQAYPGAIGYLMPLTERQLITQLQETSVRLKNAEVTTIIPGAIPWERDVQASQSTETSEQIAALQLARQNKFEQDRLQQEQRLAHYQAEQQRIIGDAALKLYA